MTPEISEQTRWESLACQKLLAITPTQRSKFNRTLATPRNKQHLKSQKEVSFIIIIRKSLICSKNVYNNGLIKHTRDLEGDKSVMFWWVTELWRVGSDAFIILDATVLHPVWL